MTVTSEQTVVRNRCLSTVLDDILPMANQLNEGFRDNWAYLKTELSWLDRMLMMALSRYRHDKKGIDRIAQSKADKASSHWWKGVISLDGKIAYDEYRPNAKIYTDNKTTSSKSAKSTPSSSVLKTQPGYQQQLENRIKISHSQGIVLTLPWLRDRLNLSVFEKNLVLMGLAPEVNRRYARLYRYLQSQDENPVTDLPTVELVLRLLCRNDQEWRRARSSLSPDSPLIRHGLVMILCSSHEPFLNATVRLADEFVDCLLAETPELKRLEQLLVNGFQTPLGQPAPWPLPDQCSVDWANDLAMGRTDTSESVEDCPDCQGDGVMLQDGGPTASIVMNSTGESQSGESQSSDGETTDAEPVQGPTWDDLVLEPALKQSLQHLGQRLRLHDTVKQSWGDEYQSFAAAQPGLLILFAGPVGTGKTLAARILSQELSSTLYSVDLASVMDIDYLQLLDELETLSHPILLFQSAERWFSRSSAMPTSRLMSFLAQRRKRSGLTIMSVSQMEAVSRDWQQQCDQMLAFSLPTPQNCHLLWQRAFPSTLKADRKINWDALSNIPLSGGDIVAIAHDALIRMAASASKTLKLDHLVSALQWHKVANRQIQSFSQASRSSRTRTSTTKSSQSAASKSSKATKSTSKTTTQSSTRRSRTSNSKTSSSKTSKTQRSKSEVEQDQTPATNISVADSPETSSDTSKEFKPKATKGATLPS